eukprot:gnl/MRDRNA2_/MRDRNA2_116969_c0_seq1.p1 gnl/MRDRNA2_/MRDRNA2_116969_c0~~gnl/MRDRNA2_/MRDRNA2_116969_c0_seq1.p1  ORF type:complete len:285 (-),score=44.00 gnl/MRDRNA2_/MRDRNA2_116969_c0_seq1:69-923(-)
MAASLPLPAPLLVIVTFGVMVLSNVLAAKGYFGDDNKTLSDQNPTYVTPDGPTFAIWGIIYTLQIILVIMQLMPSERTDDLMAQRCPFFGFNARAGLSFVFCMNACWLPAFNSRRFGLALCIMALYLAGLVCTYAALSSGSNSLFEYAFFVAPISMNTSWILVASMVSIFFCGRSAGWQDEHGVGGSVPAAVAAVLLVAAFGCYQAVAHCDLAYAFAAGWALKGIYRMQTVPDKVRFPIMAMSSFLANCAWWASNVVFAASLLGIGIAINTTLQDPFCDFAEKC